MYTDSLDLNNKPSEDESLEENTKPTPEKNDVPVTVRFKRFLTWYRSLHAHDLVLLINKQLRRFAFLRLDDEKKEEVAVSITEDSKPGTLYWLEIVLSSAIATFGLMQNSAPVIIGAMLIAPLMRPIQAMSFGVISGKPRLFWRSAQLLATSVFLSVVFAYISATVIPIRTETSEILARTSPNMIDLFIATSSAIVAFLALSFKRLSASVAGVAMAASLMPPLAVTGIELTLRNSTNAWGSLFLFVTNLFAILIVGIFILFLYGFSPHQLDDQKRSLRKIIVLLALIYFISIPLFTSLVNISKKVRLERRARIVFEQTLKSQVPTSTLHDLIIQQNKAAVITFKADITLPETQIFSRDIEAMILAKLNETFRKDVIVDIDIQRVKTITTFDL